MATNPRNAIISQIQSMAPELLKGVDVNALEDVFLNSMLDEAKRIAYGKRELAYNQANPNKQYAFENPADYFQAYGTIPVNFQGSSGYDTKSKAQDIRYLTPDANASYRLVSPKSGKVLGTGTGQQGLLDLATQANRLNTELGRKADWQLVQTGPSGDQVIGTNKYNSDRTLLGKIFGPILDVGLPVLGTALIPGAGLLGTVLPAAVGSGVASAANNRSLKSALTRAAITAATAGIGEKLMGPASQGSNAASKAAINSDLIPNATQGLSWGALTQVDPTAALAAGAGAVGAGAGAGTGAGAGAGAARFPEEIIVTAKNAMSPAAISALTAGTAGGLLAATSPGSAAAPSSTAPAGDTKNILDKLAGKMSVSDYLMLAGLLGGAVAGSGGGGSGQAASPYSSVLGPAPTVGGAQTATTRQLNTPYAGDYEKYGFGPEYQFFKQPA
jgi:hypothetical protein